MPTMRPTGGPGETNARLHEAALLARAVENVFRKLIRFLVGRITLVKLQEMIRHIYVEETERKLREENPGKNVPLTRLALSTGLDTRTLSQVRKRLQLDEARYRQQFLAELTPESAVVEAWARRISAAQDKGEREARASLDYGADDAGFETLVRSTISTRGITIPSIIQRLVDTNSVAQDKDGRSLRLLVDHYSPYLSQDEPNIVNAALSAVSNLVSTVEHNVGADPDDKLFQRQKWTFRLAPEDRDAFRRAMRELLERYESGAEEAIEPWEQARYADRLITAGVGFYYFEETPV